MPYNALKMGIPLKQGKTDSSSAAGRRSTRLAIAIPISLSGKDASDRAFKENSRTVIINKQGAKVITFHELALGSEVMVENRALGRSAKATIVWLGDRKSSKDPQEVGVQLFEAQNIWGIDFAPEDWQEGPPIGEGGQRLEKMPAPPAGAATAMPSSPAVEEAPPPQAAEAPAVAAEARDALEERFRQLEVGFSKLTQELSRRPLFSGAEAHPQEQSIPPVLEQRLASFEQRIETLLAKVQQPPQAASTGSASPQAPIDTREIDAALRQGLQDFQKQIQEEIERATAQLRELSQREAERVNKLAEEHVAQRAESLLDSIKAAGEQSTGRVQLAGEELERKLADAAQEQRTAIEEQAASALETLQQKLQTQVGELQGHIDKALGEARDKGARDVEALLQKTAAGFLESAARDLEKRVAGTASRLATELQTVAKTLVDDTRLQFEMTKQSALEGLTQDAKQVAKDYPVQVRKQLQEFQDQRAHELEEHLQKALEKQRQAVLKQIQLVGDDTANRAVTQLKTQCELVVKEITETLGKEGGPAATILKDWEEQAQAKLGAYSQLLDGSFQASVEALQEQAGQLSTTVLERVREDAQNLLKELQAHLDQAGRGLLEKSQKELEEKIREFMLKQLEESDAEFDKRSAENLELVTEQLKEKQEDLVTEATEMFRSTLGQMLLGPQPASRKSEGTETPRSKKRR
ncbi:MAG: hypothetical protein LAO07_00070 [Acidobacteriia bacterium]|nr:hypothetical protein [Terriglobia bacterium]